jgi:hypothetical protein
MYENYIVTVKSNRGIDTLKFNTCTPESKPETFKKELIERINNYYFDQVNNIEILAIIKEKNISRI